MSGKILNFGSLNIDRVYSVPHIVTPGETITSSKYAEHVGGKGLNQSIALARAGKQVAHAGAIGSDGDLLLNTLKENEVDVQLLSQLDAKSGHTIIQVDAQGQNSIIFSAGTNYAITPAYVDDVLEKFGEGDILLIQNEINELAYIINQADAKGMQIIFNPSPFDEAVLALPLEKIDWFLLNEIEARQITKQADFDETVIFEQLKENFAEASFLITCGDQGSMCYTDGKIYRQAIYPTTAVDTTGAGDTFTGYFIASLLEGEGIQVALNRASKASSIAVSREGASSSIPLKEEVVL